MTEPAEVVRAMFDAYRTQDADACARLLADDFVFTSSESQVFFGGAVERTPLE